MSSFIGAAFPWMGGKMADLLGLQGDMVGSNINGTDTGSGGAAATAGNANGSPMGESLDKNNGSTGVGGASRSAVNRRGAGAGSGGGIGVRGSRHSSRGARSSSEGTMSRGAAAAAVAASAGRTVGGLEPVRRVRRRAAVVNNGAAGCEAGGSSAAATRSAVSMERGLKNGAQWGSPKSAAGCTGNRGSGGGGGSGGGYPTRHTPNRAVGVHGYSDGTMSFVGRGETRGRAMVEMAGDGHERRTNRGTETVGSDRQEGSTGAGDGVASKRRRVSAVDGGDGGSVNTSAVQGDTLPSSTAGPTRAQEAKEPRGATPLGSQQEPHQQQLSSPDPHLQLSEHSHRSDDFMRGDDQGGYDRSHFSEKNGVPHPSPPPPPQSLPGIGDDRGGASSQAPSNYNDVQKDGVRVHRGSCGGLAGGSIGYGIPSALTVGIGAAGVGAAQDGGSNGAREKGEGLERSNGSYEGSNGTVTGASKDGRITVCRFCGGDIGGSSAVGYIEGEGANISSTSSACSCTLADSTAGVTGGTIGSASGSTADVTGDGGGGSGGGARLVQSAQRLPSVFPPDEEEGNNVCDGYMRRSRRKDRLKRRWCWKTHEYRLLDATDMEGHVEGGCTARSPHRETQLRAEDAARRFQTHRLLPSASFLQPAVSNWPHPSLQSRPQSTSTVTTTTTATNASMQPSQKNVQPSGGSSGSSSDPAAASAGTAGTSTRSLNGDTFPGCPSQLDDRVQAATARSTAPESAMLVSGVASGATAAAAAGLGMGRADSGSPAESAAGLVGGGEAPVISNGVLVPRPSLWAGANSVGAGAWGQDRAAGSSSSLPQSRIKSASGRGAGSGSGNQGTSTSTGASSSSTDDFDVSINGKVDGGGPGDGDGGSLTNGSTSRSISSSSPLRSTTTRPCPEGTKAAGASNGNEKGSGGAGRGGGGERLAWIGDQRQLLPRPSATLQLRRRKATVAVSSGQTSPSKTAAAYLGRLDLVAAIPEQRRDRKACGFGSGGSGGAGGSHQAWSAAAGVARMTLSPLSGSRRWSVEGGDAGSARGGDVRTDRADGGSLAGSDDVTHSSSGSSATSGEDSDDVDDAVSSSLFAATAAESGSEDYAVVESVCVGGGDSSGSRGGQASTTPALVQLRRASSLSSRHRQEHPVIVSNGGRHMRMIAVAGVTAESESVVTAANETVNLRQGGGRAGAGAGAGAGGRGGKPVDKTSDSNEEGFDNDIVDLSVSAISSEAKRSRKKKDEHDDTGADAGDQRVEAKEKVASNSSANTVNLVSKTCSDAAPKKYVTGWENFDHAAARRKAARLAAEAKRKADAAAEAAAAAAARRNKSRSRKAMGKAPKIPPPPPPVPRKWPARPANRALVYAAAAEASRRARGFNGWLFPALPPPPPPPPRPPTPPPPTVLLDDTAVESDVKGEGGGVGSGTEASEGGEAAESSGGGRRRRRGQDASERVFLGFARDNPPGKSNPNEFGWLPPDPLLTEEGRAAARQRAIERIAERKRQAILEELRKKEEIAEARRKRKLNILFLGMTRVAEYDCIGGLAKGKKRFDIVEKRVREDVDETNMNPLRDTARVLAMEALGHEVRCVSKVATPGEADNERARSTRAKGGPTGLGRFLATDITNTGASRGFVRRIEEKWENTIFDTVLLDHYWLPDSVVWLNKGYMANDGGLIHNLVLMTNTRLLREDFEIMLPINQAFFELLLPHFHDLEKHFTVEFLVGERLEHLKKSHLALEADELIPAEVMLNIYGKEREHQVSHMLGVKQPTADVAAVLLRYGVAAQHFCYARFLKLTRNPKATAAFAASSAVAEAAKKPSNSSSSSSATTTKTTTNSGAVGGASSTSSSTDTRSIGGSSSNSRSVDGSSSTSSTGGK